MKSEPELLDVVELKADIPGTKRARGERGTIVECFPGGVFLVEFEPDDDDGDSLHEVVAGDLRVVWRAASRSSNVRSSA